MQCGVWLVTCFIAGMAADTASGHKFERSDTGSRRRVASENHMARVASTVNAKNETAQSYGGAVSAVPDEALAPGKDSYTCEAISSCCDSEGRAKESARPSPSRSSSDAAGLLHQLSNAVTAVLLNAQLLEWKLPPYSHLKRAVREIARNAQLAAELLRRLTARWSVAEPPPVSAHLPTATVQEAGANPTCSPLADQDAAAAIVAVPGANCTPANVNLTNQCDPCTSSNFPKRDDSNQR